MAPIKDVVLGVVGNLVRVVKPPTSIIVVMKTFYVSTTSLLDRASFFKITFQPSFLKSSKKNTCVI
jgi:hypothetical protein